jgi:hypothetical protein
MRAALTVEGIGSIAVEKSTSSRIDLQVLPASLTAGRST